MAKLHLDRSDVIVALAGKHSEHYIEVRTRLAACAVIIAALSWNKESRRDACIGVKLVQNELAFKDGGAESWGCKNVFADVVAFVARRIGNDYIEFAYGFAEVTGCLARKGGKGRKTSLALVGTYWTLYNFEVRTLPEALEVAEVEVDGIGALGGGESEESGGSRELHCSNIDSCENV